jgi:hypothetical protein
MSQATQAAISTWVTLLGGIISIGFIVHASGSLTERLSEHDRTIIELKEVDRASIADRRAMAVLLERCLSTVERLEKKIP